MKSVYIFIFLLSINLNSFSQVPDLNTDSSVILSESINNQKCYESKRTFYGCVAGLSSLSRLKSQQLFLVQKIYGDFTLDSKIGINGRKYYNINFHSKYFVKALIEDFYHQEKRFSFDALLARISKHLSSTDLLKVLNTYYAFRYDFHSYLSLDRVQDTYGLPLALNRVNNKTYVQFVYPYSVASQQNIKKGDRVVSVNGTLTQGLSHSEISSLWSWNESSFITLEVERNGHHWKVYFATTKNMLQEKLVNPDTLYLRFSSIDPGVHSMVKSSLKRNLVSNVVLDLRSVDGGYVKSALNIASLFLEERSWVKLYDISNAEKQIIDVPSLVQRKYKVFILVDEETKSAAEMLAGLVSITENSLLIGNDTYGKGSVQKRYDWKYSSSIAKWKTFAFYRLPEWGKIQKYGLEVDIKLNNEIPGSLKEKDYYLSLNDTGVEVNDYLKYPLRRSFSRSDLIECVEDQAKSSKWPKYKTKDKVLDAALSGIDC